MCKLVCAVFKLTGLAVAILARVVVALLLLLPILF